MTDNMIHAAEGKQTALKSFIKKKYQTLGSSTQGYLLAILVFIPLKIYIFVDKTT